MLQELYLVRHATADRASGVPYHTLPGPPLTPAGRLEAAQAAGWLAGRGITHLFASPFVRTRETAEVIAQRLNLTVTCLDLLREGAPGESLQQIRQRVADLVPQLDDGPATHVAIISHGAPIQALLQHTTSDRIDLSKHRYDYGNSTPPAGIWHAVRCPGGAWRWELAFRPQITHEAHGTPTPHAL